MFLTWAAHYIWLTLDNNGAPTPAKVLELLRYFGKSYKGPVVFRT